jgi:zinc transport system substrate-binding protein
MGNGRTGGRKVGGLGIVVLAAVVISALLALFVVVARRDGGPGAGASGVRVFVPVPPLADFVRHIGGSHVDVSVLVDPGRSPHTFEPTPRQMADLSEADVYFTVGLPFEREIARKLEGSLADLRIVDASEGVTFLMSPVHGDEGEHHGETERDPHIWLDPLRAKIVAGNMARALAEVDAGNRPTYERGLTAFEKDLDALHERVSRMIEPVRGKAFLVFHSSFGYFAERYGLVEVPVEVMGKEPSARELTHLVERAREIGARVIFVQAQFARTSAEAVARETGTRLVDLDPLGTDYVRSIEEIAGKLADALGDDASGFSEGSERD